MNKEGYYEKEELKTNRQSGGEGGVFETAGTENQTENKEGKKQSKVERIKDFLFGKKPEELPEIWTGSTSLLDTNDVGHRRRQFHSRFSLKK